MAIRFILADKYTKKYTDRLHKCNYCGNRVRYYSGESCQHAVQQLYAEYDKLNGIVY